MGRQRKIKSPAEMLAKWRAYKESCDNATVRKSIVNYQTGEVLNVEQLAPVTVTIEGFSLYIGMYKQSFHATYVNDEKYDAVIQMIKTECEQDARRKFENGTLNPRLAGLWLSNYGYTTKTDNNITGAVPVVIGGYDDIKE